MPEPYSQTGVKALALFLVNDEEGKPSWISIDLGGGRAHIWRREDSQSLFDRLAHEVQHGHSWNGGIVNEKPQSKVTLHPKLRRAGKTKLNINLEDLLS